MHTWTWHGDRRESRSAERETRTPVARETHDPAAKVEDQEMRRRSASSGRSSGCLQLEGIDGVDGKKEAENLRQIMTGP